MRTLGLLLLVAAIVVVGGSYGRDWWRVDSCLDGGGSFNFGYGQCDYSANHPYVSYFTRHSTLLLGGAAAALVGLILATRRRAQRPVRAS